MFVPGKISIGPAQGAIYYKNRTYSFQKGKQFFFLFIRMDERAWNIAADFEGLENDVLDGILWHFYAEVRNADGQLYSKSTFVGNLRASIRGRPFDSEGRGAWQRTMLPFAGHWHPVWSKKQDCRIKLIWYLNTIDKVPIYPHGAHQV